MLRSISKQRLYALKPHLDRLVEEVEIPSYIDQDPVLFMHWFEDKLDRELAGFFAAIMAWGRRDIVIRKVDDLLARMFYEPADFIRNFTDSDATLLEGFKHRTFKPVDIYWLIKILQKILEDHGGFEEFWTYCYTRARNAGRPLPAVFHREFFRKCPDFSERTRKHISDAEKNSSCKRIYLYLRWVIRKNSMVDPGTMEFMESSELMIPLDVHVARQARRLGLLTYKSNNWKAVQQLTANLCHLDPDDPAKYDYALFGLGVGKNGIPSSFYINKVN